MASNQKKKKLSKFIVPAAIVLVIGGFILFQSMSKKTASLPSVGVTTVVISDIENSIGVEGIIASDTSEKVMPKLALAVLENKVKVGAVVKAGDVLCLLDSKDTENTIAQQQSTVNVSTAGNNQSVSNAQKELNRASSNVSNGKDSSIAQAEQGVTSAKQGVTQAEQGLRKAEQGLRQAESAVETAGLAFRSAQDAVKDKRAEADWDGYELQDFQTNSLVNQREAAYLSYEQAKDGVTDAKQAIEDAKQGIINAKKGVEDAENSLVITKNSVSQRVDSLADSVATARVSARSTETQELAISHLQEGLEDATVLAPVDGTVTYVNDNVIKGAPATGIMYIIEDVNKLKVVATVKEYDMINITDGTPAEIRSELSGEEQYSGKVSKISPTAIKNAQGTTANPADPDFEIEIDVPATDTLLKIGTKARVDLIYEKKENVLAVPVNALSVNELGEDIVFVLQEESEGVLRTVAVPVQVGIESDALVEIHSDALKEGDEIVALTQGVVEGMLVQKAADGGIGSAAGGMGGGMGMGMTVTTGKRPVTGLDTMRYGK